MSDNAPMREWSAYELEIAIEVFAEYGEQPRPASSHVALPHRPERMIDTSDWSLTQTTTLVRFGMRFLGKIYDWQHRKDGGKR